MFSRIATISFRSALIFVAMAGERVVLGATHAASMVPPPGIAWRVDGAWKEAVTGRLIHKGDPVLAGALVRPADPDGPHSLTVLLPDGQRVANECFTVPDCSRGFRIPALNAAPELFNAEVLRLAGAALLRDPEGDGIVRRSLHTTSAGLDEAVVQIGGPTQPGNSLRRVTLGGLPGSLPAGRYTYNLLSVIAPAPSRFHQAIQKTSADLTFLLAGPGLYKMEVFDSLNTQRVDVVFAVTPPGDTNLAIDFEHARKVLAAWDEQYYGWPVHDLLRAYLRARVAMISAGAGRAGSLP